MKKLFRIMIVALTFMISVNHVWANGITVFGTITEKDNAPLPEAKVSFISELGDTISTYTDEMGKYSLALMYYTGVGENNPDVFTLSQNYPNPFNPSTTIEFSLAKSSEVSLDIYNITGQKIRTLSDSYLIAGYHSFKWDGIDKNGRAVAAGVYIYTLKANGMMKSRKMVLTDGKAAFSSNNDRQSGVMKPSIYTNTVYDVLVEKDGFETYKAIGFLIRTYNILYEPNIQCDINIYRKQTAFGFLFDSPNYNREFFLHGDLIKIEALRKLGFTVPDSFTVDLTTGLGDKEPIMLRKGNGFAPRFDDCRSDTDFYPVNLEGSLPSKAAEIPIIGNGILEASDNDIITVSGSLSDSLLVTASIPILKLRTEVIFGNTYMFWNGNWYFYRKAAMSLVRPDFIEVKYKTDATKEEIDALNLEFGLIEDSIIYGIYILKLPINTDPIELLLEYSTYAIVDWVNTDEIGCAVAK